MPIHDWTLVDAGIFHHFHHQWISEIARALNDSLRGTNYYALAEQIAGGLGPDVLTLQHPEQPNHANGQSPDVSHRSVAVATSPPKLRFRISNPPSWYAAKKKAVAIHHVSEHRVIAVLEIVSPGNKASRSGMAVFVRKAQDLLAAGVHLDFVDLFPPTPRDPEGLHPLVWGDDDSDTFRFDSSKPLTCAAYIGGEAAEAHVEPLSVGDHLPSLPLFLRPEEYVSVPLEMTYQSAYSAVPDIWRTRLSKPV